MGEFSMSLRRSISVLLRCVGAGALWALAACDTSENRIPTPLRVGYIPVLSGLPTFVALHDSLFERAGFSVRRQEYRTSDLAVKALELGEIDLVGVAGLTQALQLAQSKPGSVRLLGVLNSSTALIVSTAPGAPKTVSELRGKTIGCFPGSVFETYTRKAMESLGVPSRGLTVVPLPPPLQAQALKDGRVDAVYTLEPTAAVAVGAGDARYLTSEDVFAKAFLGGAKFPGGGALLSEAFVKRVPNAPDRLIAVLREATDLIATPSFEIAPYIDRFAPVAREAAPHLVFEGAAFGRQVDTVALGRLVERLQEWALLDASFRLESIFHH